MNGFMSFSKLFLIISSDKFTASLPKQNENDKKSDGLIVFPLVYFLFGIEKFLRQHTLTPT